MVKQAPDDFIAASEAIVQRWYEAYKESEDAPSADAFVVLYELDTRMQLAFLKVNYQDGYTHFIDNGEAGIENNLILHRALLAGKTQKADEGITIDVESLDFELIEKKYSFSGQKFETPTYNVVADLKEAVYDTIEESGHIDVSEVAQKVFKDNITAQLSFQEEVVEKGFVNQAPMMRDVREISEKKFGKQKLKLSNGIELIVPLDVYRDPNLIEFINNPDGTISVTIKNVEEVINRM